MSLISCLVNIIALDVDCSLGWCLDCDVKNAFVMDPGSCEERVRGVQQYSMGAGVEQPQKDKRGLSLSPRDARPSQQPIPA